MFGKVAQKKTQYLVFVFFLLTLNIVCVKVETLTKIKGAKNKK